MKFSMKNAISTLTFLLVISASPVLANEQKLGTISVSGNGTVSVEPDMARITFGVQLQAKTARLALNANNEAMASVLKAMKEKGIAEKDIQTSQFNIQPNYFYPKSSGNGQPQPPRITGYTVTNSVMITVRDLSLTGQILDEVVSLGVNNGGSIDFMNADTSGILQVAREKAVKDAVSKANTLAQAAGVELGRILSISEGSFQPQPRAFARAQSSRVLASESVVPVASGEETYRVDVQVNWEIKQ